MGTFPFYSIFVPHNLHMSIFLYLCTVFLIKNHQLFSIIYYVYNTSKITYKI